jgi:hypothetical protein
MSDFLTKNVSDRIDRFLMELNLSELDRASILLELGVIIGDEEGMFPRLEAGGKFNPARIPGDPAPVDIGTVSGFTTLDYLTGRSQRAIAADDVYLAIPLHPKDGARIEFWLSPSNDISVNLHENIIISEDSPYSFPMDIAKDLTWIISLEYNFSKSRWHFLSLIGGF